MGGSLGQDNGESAKTGLKDALREHGINDEAVIGNILKLAEESAKAVQGAELVI
jgi:hypothetical protein